MLDAFVARYPTDTTGAQAQSMIGDSHCTPRQISPRDLRPYQNPRQFPQE